MLGWRPLETYNWYYAQDHMSLTVSWSMSIPLHLQVIALSNGVFNTWNFVLMNNQLRGCLINLPARIRMICGCRIIRHGREAYGMHPMWTFNIEFRMVSYSSECEMIWMSQVSMSSHLTLNCFYHCHHHLSMDRRTDGWMEGERDEQIEGGREIQMDWRTY